MCTLNVQHVYWFFTNRKYSTLKKSISYQYISCSTLSVLIRLYQSWKHGWTFENNAMSYQYMNSCTWYVLTCTTYVLLLNLSKLSLFRYYIDVAMSYQCISSSTLIVLVCLFIRTANGMIWTCLILNDINKQSKSGFYIWKSIVRYKLSLWWEPNNLVA